MRVVDSRTPRVSNDIRILSLILKTCLGQLNQSQNRLVYTHLKNTRTRCSPSQLTPIGTFTAANVTSFLTKARNHSQSTYGYRTVVFPYNPVIFANSFTALCHFQRLGGILACLLKQYFLSTIFCPVMLFRSIHFPRKQDYSR